MLAIIFSLIGIALALFLLKAIVPWITGIDALTNEVKGLRKDLKALKDEDSSI